MINRGGCLIIMEEQNSVVLITGANKGIGFEVARQLGDKGFTILIGARSKERGEEAEIKLKEEGIDVHFIQIDVINQLSIDNAAKKIRESYGKLDVLINNVGVALDRRTISELDINLLKETFNTNFFSMVSVTKAMLPLIRKSQAGRIVNMSSGLGSLKQQSDPNYEFYDTSKFLGYNASKTAVNQFTVHLAYELNETKIKVNSADPGYTSTALNNFRGARSVQQAATVVVRLATLSEDGPTGGFFDENGVVPW